MVSFCKQNLEYGSSDKIRRVFWEVKEEEVDRPTALQPGTLTGCKKMHCFWGNSKTDSTLLAIHEYICMCKDCMEGYEENCAYGEWISKWLYRNLTLNHPVYNSQTDTREAVDFEVGSNHEHLSDALVLGDVFAMPGEDEELEYYLLRCKGVKRKIRKKEQRCQWNIDHVFTRDEVVVFGTYFQNQKKLKRKVVFMETECRENAIIYSHLVRVVKVRLSSMVSTSKRKGGHAPRFFLDEEMHVQILEAVSEGDSPDFFEKF